MTIDPSYTLGIYTIADTWVDSGSNTSTQSTSAELRTGTTNSGTTKARSFLKFNGDDIWINTTVNSATLTLRNFASSTCVASSIQAARITEGWSSLNLTWANQPSVTTAGQAYYAPAAGADGCPSANADWNVTAIVKSWAENLTPNNGIRLAGVNEASNNTYRRYRSAEYTDYDGNFRPKLTVNYTPPDTTPPALPIVNSLNVAVNEYADPLPPGHSFTLESGETTVNTFLVSADGGSRVTVSGSGGMAEYPWSPGPGPHTLAVSSRDPSGNQSGDTIIKFGIRSYITLAEPVVVLEADLAPNEELTTGLESFPNATWPEVDSFDAYATVEGWPTDSSGSVTVADGGGVYPESPTVSWNPAIDPAVGTMANVEVVTTPDAKVILRNDSSSPVSLTLTMTGWWRRFPALEDDPSTDEPDPEGTGTDTSGDPAEDAPVDTSLPESTCEVQNSEGDELCTFYPEPTPELVADVAAVTAAEDAVPDSERQPNPDGEDAERAQRVATLNAPEERACYAPLTKDKWSKSRFGMCSTRLVTHGWIRNGALVAYAEMIIRRNITMGRTKRDFLLTVRHSILKQTGLWRAASHTVNASTWCTGGCWAGYSRTYTRQLGGSYPLPKAYDRIFESDLNGYDVKMDYRIDGVDNWTIYSTQLPPASMSSAFDASLLVRCDNHHYLGPPGCRVVAEEPIMLMNYNGTGSSDPRKEYKQAARFYAYVQDEVYPFGVSGKNWFTRANPTQTGYNRNANCGGIRYPAPGSCDEFPFAATLQACSTSGNPKACNHRNVLSTHNSYAGSLIGGFMTRNRILRNFSDEQFYFRISGG